MGRLVDGIDLSMLTLAELEAERAYQEKRADYADLTLRWWSIPGFTAAALGWVMFPLSRPAGLFLAITGIGAATAALLRITLGMYLIPKPPHRRR